MGPSLPPVPASDERQANQVEGCMQAINVFEEMAIHSGWKRIQSVLHHILLARAHMETTPFCSTANPSASPQNIEKSSHTSLLHPAKDNYPTCFSPNLVLPRAILQKGPSRCRTTENAALPEKTSPSEPTMSVQFQVATVPAFLWGTTALLFSPPVSKT